MTGFTNIKHTEQQSMFEVAFADVWRNAQRRRSAYIGSWVAKVFRRSGCTDSITFGIPATASQSAPLQAQYPSLAFSTDCTPAPSGSDEVVTKRERVA